MPPKLKIDVLKEDQMATCTILREYFCNLSLSSWSESYCQTWNLNPFYCDKYQEEPGVNFQDGVICACLRWSL
jgi:hypothetical protein